MKKVNIIKFSQLHSKSYKYAFIDELGLWDVGYNLIPIRKERAVDIVVSMKKFISEFEDYKDELFNDSEYFTEQKKLKLINEFELLKKELKNVDYIFLTE